MKITTIDFTKLFEKFEIEQPPSYKNYTELYLTKNYPKCNSCGKHFDLNRGCKCRVNDLGLT